MEYKLLFIFVEGENEMRFFERMLEPLLKQKYSCIKIVPYSKKERKWDWINDFIRSINKMKFASYIFVTDINTAPCVAARKEEIKNKIRNISDDRIMVVVKEIESWYMAGVSENFLSKNKIKVPKNTDDFMKEDFEKIIPKKFSKREFLIEMLKYFSCERAQKKNKSFKYFMTKFDC